MSILITGSTGQLGQELKKIPDDELITPTRQQLDITDRNIIKKIIDLNPK